MGQKWSNFENSFDLPRSILTPNLFFVTFVCECVCFCVLLFVIIVCYACTCWVLFLAVQQLLSSLPEACVCICVSVWCCGSVGGKREGGGVWFGSARLITPSYSRPRNYIPPLFLKVSMLELYCLSTQDILKATTAHLAVIELTYILAYDLSSCTPHAY